MSAISPAKIATFKRQAKRTEKTSGISHWQTLDQIAIQYGFSNWSLFAKSVKKSGATPSKPYKVQIHCYISRESGNIEPCFWVEEIPSLYPEKHYADMGWIPFRHGIIRKDRNQIAEKIATVRRGIDFMDVTGLKTSRAWTSLFGEKTPYGFDHTYVWRDELKRIVVTTEPYFNDQVKINKLIEWCKANEWQLIHAPKDVGIWNPCKSTCNDDCKLHTNMFILAPKKNGGDVKKVLSKLESAQFLS